MCKKFLCLAIVLLPFITRAQQTMEDLDRGIDMMVKQGQVRREGNKIIFLNQRPGDTAFLRDMYNKMLEQTDKSKNPYTIAFEIAPQYLSKAPVKKNIQPVVKDTVKTYTYQPTPSRAITTYRSFQYLQNGDFELGYFRSLPGWRIQGKAFMQREGMDRYTWQDFDIVPMADIGGDYWEDIKFHTGYKHQHWITSKSESVFGGSDEAGGATGTLTSVPFKLYPNQNFISFLIAGGKNEGQLKVEFLECIPGVRLTGNVANLQQNRQSLPGTSTGRVGNTPDTTYKTLPGIDAKTGHNSFIFRREWWEVQGLDTSKLYVIRVTDNATDIKWGVINVDDFRMLKNNPVANNEGDDSLKVQVVTVRDKVENTDQQIIADVYVPIYGAADLHTHLMSYLGMGHKLMYGAPDIGSIVPAGTYFCNPQNYRATSVEQCLGNCNAAHGGWGLTDNTCGNYLRAAILNFAFDGDYEKRVPLERNLHGDHPHEGYPDFLYWPHFSSASHQQMYVDWIKRAYQGGLRVLVTLTVNSELLGGVLSGDGPLDDKSVADLQLTEIDSFVSRHSDFMQIARTPEDMRSIIRSNKMAVVIGMEVDNIGNFNYADVAVNESTVKAEIQRLYNKGVRYIFPIHLVNNKFGGSAIYSLLFNMSNKYTNSRPLPWGVPIPPGFMFNVERASDPRIRYTLSLTDGTPTGGSINAAIFGMSAFLAGIAEIPYPPAFDLGSCPIPKLGCIDQFKIVGSLLTMDPAWDVYNSIPGGQQNQQGLTGLGKFAVRQMMQLGMMIDVDHMSDHSVNDALALANLYNYPVASGHNGMRDGFFEDPGHKVSENQRTNEHLQQIRRLGGVFGVGIGEATAGQYLSNFRLAMNAVKMNGGAIMMGSDINGFVTMPKPRHGDGRGAERSRYRDDIYTNWDKLVNYAAEGGPTYNNTTHVYSVRKYKFGNKTWDYNTEGVAHIGLYPDYYQDLKNLGMTQQERQVFFTAADYFVNMWDKCEKSKANVR